MMRSLVAVLLLSALPALHARAAEPSLDRVLVPISSVPAPGAFGSLWTCELWAHNGSGRVMTLAVLRSTHQEWMPGASRPVDLSLRPLGMSPGQFLVVAGARAEEVTFHLRIRDVSRQLETWGTELPVVPARAFRETVHLTSVPLEPRFRSMLRLYAAPYHAEARIRVRITSLSSPPRTIEQIVTATGGGDAAGREAAYVQWSLSDVAALAGVERVHVEAASLDGVPIWGFVTVTNNETQHVTTVTPTPFKAPAEPPRSLHAVP